MELDPRISVVKNLDSVFRFAPHSVCEDVQSPFGRSSRVMSPYAAFSSPLSEHASESVLAEIMLRTSRRIIYATRNVRPTVPAVKSLHQMTERAEESPDLRCLERFCGAPVVGSSVSAIPELEALFGRVMSIATAACRARRNGNEATALEHFRSALALALEASERYSLLESSRVRMRLLGVVVCLSLSCGDADAARGHITGKHVLSEPGPESEEWAGLRSIESWPDAWLVAAVRRDPPDAASLDALAARYWRRLFGRCELLTLNREKAGDLAQEAWRRVLRNRHALKPGGNFPAYLHMIAANIWRDWYRAARRAGAMADDRLASLNGAISTDDGGMIALGDVIPDLRSLDAEAQRLLMLDIDHALGSLDPHLREVIVARFLNEESCAEIGRRHGRTEQTISAWVREGVRQMKLCLERPCDGSRVHKEQT